MKIEVFTDLTRKGIFSFPNDQVVVVGRQADANILLEGKDISRDHLHIIYKNNRVYVLDQGSTYGVFINDQKITPFKEVEFTTYFQVKVGPNFFLSLLDHDDEDEYTRPIKLSAQNRTQTLNAYKAKAVIPKAIAEKTRTDTIKVVSRTKATPKIPAKKSKPSSSNSSTYLLLILLAAAAGFWYLSSQGKL